MNKVNNEEIRIRLRGRKDKRENDFYVAVTRMPANLSLDGSVFLFFPDEGEDGNFGGDLVITKHDPDREKSRDPNGNPDREKSRDPNGNPIERSPGTQTRTAK